MVSTDGARCHWFDVEEAGERDAGAGAGAGPGKRVKWDRGLHTTVFLEDTPPRPCWNVKAVPSSKGCLTPAAKVCVFRVPLRLSEPLGLIDFAFSRSYVGPAAGHAG